MNRGGGGRRSRLRGGRSAQSSTRQPQVDPDPGTPPVSQATPEIIATTTPASSSISNLASVGPIQDQDTTSLPPRSRTSTTGRVTRFRPKNVRRNEEERARIAEEESKKQSERLAAERRQRGKLTYRGRRGGRGIRPGMPHSRSTGSQRGQDTVTSNTGFTPDNGPKSEPGGAISRGHISIPSAGPSPTSSARSEAFSLPNHEREDLKIDGRLFYRPLWDSDTLTEEERAAVEYLKSLPGPLPMARRREQHYEANTHDENEGLTGQERSEKDRKRHGDFLLQCFTQGLENGESKPFMFTMPPPENLPLLRPAREGPRIKSEYDDVVMLGGTDAEATGEATDALPAIDKDDEIDEYYNNYNGEPKFQYSGHVGKLRVRKSGRAVLDWGGMEMELFKGGEIGGSLSYMVIEDDETKDPNFGPTGRAVSMGQLHGTIGVCTLDERTDEDWKDRMLVGEESLETMVMEAAAKLDRL